MMETGARGQFHRYIGLPFETLILQGSSTRQLAFAVSIGVTFGLFPIMGVSIPFCFVAALVFKAPQPLTHAVNYAVYPLQIPLIFVFVRLGEWIMGAPNVSLAPTGNPRPGPHRHAPFRRGIRPDLSARHAGLEPVRSPVVRRHVLDGATDHRAPAGQAAAGVDVILPLRRPGYPPFEEFLAPGLERPSRQSR